MARGLTKKEKGFVKEYVKTGNGTKSALKNYDTKDEDCAGVIASQNLGKLKIQNAIKSIADRIPDELLEQVHLEGLRATKKSGVGGMAIGIDAGGDVESMGHENMIEPDYAVRHKYLDTAYKLKGTYAPEKKELEVNLISISEEAKAKLDKLI
jgi:phage terminase small subunit